MTQRPAPAPQRKGRGVLRGQPLLFTAAVASRLSLAVEFDDRLVEQGTTLEWLEIELDPVVRLGRCRFVADGGSASAARGRLLFVDDVYDCHSLIREGKLVDLRALFQNLPLVLEHRERVRPEFREYCARLVYDLSVHKRFFDEQEAIIVREPEDVTRAAREALLRAEGRRFLAFLDEKVREMEALIGGYTYEEHERHGFYLRRLLWPYLLSGELMRRSNLKPLGYAGDAEMMRMIYDNAHEGRNLFEQLMHKHTVETAAAEAVRSRRRLIPRVTREMAERLGPAAPGAFQVLSVACGPASEIAQLIRSADDARRFELTLLDQDPFALDLARRSVREVEAAHGVTLAVRYLEHSVRTVIRSRDLGSVIGHHHFVYSMGLFDYLTTPVARTVLAKIWSVVLPGGTLLAGNFHTRTPTRHHMAYWGDWPLLYRTEEAFMALAEGLDVAAARIEFDETGCQMFLRLDKRR